VLFIIWESDGSFFFSEDGIFVTAVVSFFFLYSIYIDAFFFPGRTKYIDLLNL